MVSNPKEFSTWAERSTFSYDGSVEIGTRIYFGESGEVEISKQQYKSLLEEFTGMEVNIGTSRDKASEESLGYWLQHNVTPTAIASYVGRILIVEGYAEKGIKHMIHFETITK